MFFLTPNHPRSSFRLSSYPQWLKTSLCLLRIVCFGRRGPLVPPSGLGLVTPIPSFTVGSPTPHTVTPHPRLPISQWFHLPHPCLHPLTDPPRPCLLTNLLHPRLPINLLHLRPLISLPCLCLLTSLSCLCHLTYLPHTCLLTHHSAMVS